MNKILLHFFLIFSTLIGCPAFATQPIAYKDIPYISGAALDQQELDIYVPEATNPQSNLPVHMYVHGGAWNKGDKKTTTAEKAKTYTDQGIILIAINYRLSPDYKHPSHIKDCATAIKWVTNNITKYGGNPKNIVLSGHSAGAHLVALLGTHPQYLKETGLALNMFKSIIPVDTATFDLTHKQKGKLARMIQRMRDKAFGTQLETLIDASPLLQAKNRSSLSPFLIFTAAERSDAVKQSKLFENALKDSNNRAKAIVIYNGYSHRDMNLAIFDPESIISKAIIQVLQ